MADVVKARGVTRTGGRSAASMVVMRRIDMFPHWDPEILERAEPAVVTKYILSTRAVQVLLGSETFNNEYLPVAERTISGYCGQGMLDWITVSKPGSKRPVRAFSRDAVEAFFTAYRDGASVPWHRLPQDQRKQLGLDY